MNRSEQAFAIHKAPHIAECIAQNLRRMTPETALRRAPMQPIHVQVIGAGHTLGPKLPMRMEEHRASVVQIAVNSAIGACVERRIRPTYIICRESLDMSEQVRRLAGYHRPVAILDIGAHPNTWAACEELCSRVVWFIPASTQTFGLAGRMGLEPLYGGTSNVTAAVAVAEMLGASAMSLHGCSRAFADDGRAYATGTGWESVRLTSVEVKEPEFGTIIGTIEGLEAKEAIHAASGQRAPLKRERVIHVDAVDGSIRYALETLEKDREWLGNFAARHPHIACHQHNPDVAIAGWGHAPRGTYTPPTFDFRAELEAQAEHAHAVTEAVTSGGRVVEAPRFLEGSDLVDYHGIGNRLKIIEGMRGRAPQETIPAVLRSWAESADRIRKLAVE